jgi:bifunctional non-homologous end joining protein LigD
LSGEVKLGIAIRENDRLRLLSRHGTDWTRCYPWIAEAALKNRQRHFVIDGEAVVLGVDGISDFNALHSHQLDEEVQFCAFDILVEHLRKTSLQRLFARRPEGIFVNPFEQGEIGPDLFHLEGLVSKHRSAGRLLCGTSADSPTTAAAGCGAPWSRPPDRTAPRTKRER